MSLEITFTVPLIKVFFQINLQNLSLFEKKCLIPEDGGLKASQNPDAIV